MAEDWKKVLADRRADKFSTIVWVNQVLPGFITISLTEFDALTIADRTSLLKAVHNLAEDQREAAEQAQQTAQTSQANTE